MTLRDFSEQARQRLIEAIDRHKGEDEQWWLFSRLIDAVSDLFIAEDIKHYAGDIARYHEAIIDKKNTTIEQLNDIINDVHGVDVIYSEYIRSINDSMTQLASILGSFSEALNTNQPDGSLAPILRSESEYQAFMAPIYEQRDAWRASFITREVERLFDLRAQAQVDELLSREEYSRAAWYTLTETEKYELLLGLIAELNMILGTKVDISILNTIDQEARADGTLLYAVYSAATNQISVNRIAINNRGDSYYIHRFMVHEVRHAYQYETINNPASHLVSEETCYQWSQNYQSENYRDGVQSEEEAAQGIEDNYEIYVSQPLEYDARAFARREQVKMPPVYQGSWEE
ncbi:MAG: hypothetical protein LBG97_04975 [Coriobacteriales bacterium]|jgi:hypothetical protein|nr:hypothetical protein [Coriobacteriales bacterium]